MSDTGSHTQKARTLPLPRRLRYLNVKPKEKTKAVFSDPCCPVGTENLHPSQRPASQSPLGFPCGKPGSC